MALEIGSYKVQITSNTVGTFGDKDAVVLNFETAAGDSGRVLIYLTPKAMNIARASLKIAGFDVDSSDITELIDKPDLLQGNEIPVLVEEYNGKVRAQIVLNSRPEKAKLSRLTDALRKAKKRDAEVADDDIPF